MATIAAMVAAVAMCATPAGAHSRRGHGDDTYYLAVGASESVGVQPVPGHPDGEPTNEGYANDIATMEQPRWPGLQLDQLGCPGITAGEALDGDDGGCHYPAGSEIATAVAFLRSHGDETVLLTVDLGFNDIWPCMSSRRVDKGCVRRALTDIEQSLPVILPRLRAAGGPNLAIVGLEHGDPFLADMDRGARTFAVQTAGVVDQMNGVLSSEYLAAGDRVADVPAAMGTAVVSDTAASRVCSLTWMCRTHNVHPDPEGYQDIADAIAAAIALPPTLVP